MVDEEVVEIGKDVEIGASPTRGEEAGALPTRGEEEGASTDVTRN